MSAQLAFQFDEPLPAPVSIRFDVIETAMLAMPQVETPTTHHFGPGVYMRQMFAAAGTLVLGREHRGPCTNVMLSGKCVLIDTDGSTRDLVAPQVFESQAGRKLAYVIDPMVWVNVWATDERDIAALERELFVGSFAEDMAEIGFTVEQVREISECTTDVDLNPNLTQYVYVTPSEIEGAGCRSRDNLQRGDYVGVARHRGVRTNIGRYTNHSSMANVEYRRMGDDVHAYALRPIAAGEEITVDYRQAVSVA